LEASQRLVRFVGGPLSRMALWATGEHIRILAYHGIRDASAFERQLEHLAERFIVVSGAQLTAALEGRHPLPRRAVWITFDDGAPEVVTTAGPLLDRFGFSATLFVCPGVIDTDRPYWWEIVREAGRLGVDEPRGITLPAGPTEAALKRCPDTVRRAYVERLVDAVKFRTGRGPRQQQLSSEDLRSWVASGREVGNHSWDHPLLDRCTPDTQVEQIERAHDWLRSTLGIRADSFAYPNGNWSQMSEATLIRLGYRTALGFDHRMVGSRASNPLRLSRLRTDADAELDRFRTIVGGVHSGLLASRQWLLHPVTHRADPRRLPR
jgi:peptidoglycan/xylan/chitin deacetylase (PgdA/CDA1 family)